MSETVVMAIDGEGKRFVFPLTQIYMGTEPPGTSIWIERAVFCPMGHKFKATDVFITSNHAAVVSFLQGKKINPKIVLRIAESNAMEATIVDMKNRRG